MVITPLIANNYLNKLMENINLSNDDLVQVHLSIDCECYVPGVDANGMLAFHKAYPAGDSSVDFKCFVPAAATASRQALLEYIWAKRDSAGAEFVNLDSANIWIPDPDNASEGRFAFS